MTRDEEWLLREKYRGERTEEFLADCARLHGGEPLAYVIGWVPFLGTTIFLDSHPLIPRPETEFWVDLAIQEIQRSGGPASVRVLDLCAGSGCIGVAVLKSVPNVSVDFAEIDGEHHETIEKNIRENGIEPARATILSGDLFENVSGTYDFILTNPPYVDPTLNRVEESVRTHEPSHALYGGRGGMELIGRIIREAPEHLSASGTLYIEHEPEQAGEITVLAGDAGLTAETFPDQYDTSRYTRLVRRTERASATL